MFCDSKEGKSVGKSGGKKAWPLRRRHESPGTMTYLNAHSELSQPQKIISRLETNFNLSPSYFAHKSANQKFSKIYEISLDANLYKTKQNKKTQTSNTIFSKNQSLRYCPCLKKKTNTYGSGHAGIVDHFVDLSKPDFESFLFCFL